jgi:hypothetical protein
VKRQVRSGGFLIGLACGGILGCAVMLAPVLWLGLEGTANWYARTAAPLRGAWQLARVNLQGSILPFVVVLAAYWVQLKKLRELLAASQPALVRVDRHEQLLDLCANLFFGIGVIWTAIGMRDALLFALGDPGVTASQGAFAILQRLVDGGILVALSTTIVGGIGGYLMRTIKSICLGEAISVVYLQASQQPAQENLAALDRIEQLLCKAGQGPQRETP